MRSHIVFTGVVLLSSAVFSADKFDERLRQSGTVMKEVLDMPDSVPLDLLHKAECVVVMPSVKKLAFGIGGSYGAGAMVCRSGKGFNGPWGPPSMYRLDGGNIGFQIGGALLHGPEQIADLPVPVAESPGAVRIGHPERSHLVEYLAPNSVFNSLPRQRSSPHLRPDERLVTIDRVLHHASLGVA